MHASITMWLVYLLSLWMIHRKSSCIMTFFNPIAIVPVRHGITGLISIYPIFKGKIPTEGDLVGYQPKLPLTMGWHSLKLPVPLNFWNLILAIKKQFLEVSSMLKTFFESFKASQLL